MRKQLLRIVTWIALGIGAFLFIPYLADSVQAGLNNKAKPGKKLHVDKFYKLDLYNKVDLSFNKYSIQKVNLDGDTCYILIGVNEGGISCNFNNK